jgi:pyruvate,water dikinase
MKWISSLKNDHHDSVALLGGKASAIARIVRAGFTVPETACLTTAAYEHFLNINGLREKIQLELSRKDFNDMRWEEIWDTSLRIRYLFLTTPVPADLEAEIREHFSNGFGAKSLAVRSSAPDEDQSGSSFAGLHASYLNITGIEQLLVHIRKVWASLWSDKALLYRQELKLSVSSSSMAVLVQKLVHSDIAGVAFTRDPLHGENMVVEAIYGLNQGLVDGEIEPDRWFVDRKSHRVVEHVPAAERSSRLVVGEEGVAIADLRADQAAVPPLTVPQLTSLIKSMVALEHSFGQPVDIEWTWGGDTFYVLQVRPITAATSGDNKDQRAWYLSLHRSYNNLLILRENIEKDMLPAMEAEAEAMSRCDPATLGNAELAAEIRSRFERSAHWSKVYWDDCIPFAHGVRLFGEIYNDLMVPDDPYQFVELLCGEQMLSTSRNSMLQQLAGMLRSSPETLAALEREGYTGVTDLSFKAKFAELERRFGNFFTGENQGEQGREDLIVRVILEYSRLRDTRPDEVGAPMKQNRQELETAFLRQVRDAKSQFDGVALLSLARASYRLRDDDNIYLGRIEQQLKLALAEGRKRFGEIGASQLQLATPEEIARLLDGEDVQLFEPASEVNLSAPSPLSSVRARQLTGQPASRGVARGRARVINSPAEMADFQIGEVLIVESVDPNMTFLAPLASGIVERRGGMLIHGAIIAREYGIPCVTGVSQVTSYITTGDMVTVDGYLGIITVDKA